MLRALLLALEKSTSGENSVIDSCLYTLLCLLAGVGIAGITTISKVEWRVLNRNVTGHNGYSSTHSLIYSLTHLLTHSPTYLLTHS
jgi:hypothetical protein